MVDTGGRTGIALAGLFMISIMIFFLYQVHQSNKPAATPGTSKADQSALDAHRQPVGAHRGRTNNTAEQPTTDTVSRDIENQEGEEEKDEIVLLEDTFYTEATRVPTPVEAVTETMPEPAAAAEKTEITEVEAEDAINPVKSPSEEIINNNEDKEIEELRAQLTNIAVPNDDEIQVLFREIDRNDDGSVSMPEVEKAIIQRKTEFDLKPTIVLRAFQKTDTDNDGKISREEFFKFIRLISYFKNLSNVFDAMDTDRNRRLNKTEFLKASKVLEIDNPDAVFQEMDENKGGYTVFDEFCIWMAEKRHDDDAL